MLSSLDVEHCRANRRAVVTFSGLSDDSAREDGARYFEALNRIQSFQLPVLRKSDTPELDFDQQKEQNVWLFESVAAAAGVNLERQHASLEEWKRMEITEEVKKACSLLSELPSPFNACAKHLVAIVLVWPCDGFNGGSFWHALGAIWISPQQQWSTTDYAENLLHESTHQAVFLDDMVRRIFSAEPDELRRDESHVISSIRRQNRRYDFAFHAATVSYSLAMFYKVLGMKEQCDTLLRPLHVTLEGLRGKDHLLTDYGRMLLGEMESGVTHC
jgi:hypothetical protein